MKSSEHKLFSTTYRWGIEKKNISILEMRIPVGVKTQLMRHGVHTMGDLVPLRPAKLYNIPGISHGIIERIKNERVRLGVLDIKD